MSTEPTKTAATNKVRPIPEGYGTVTPWIIAKGAAQLIDFLKQAFGAQEDEQGRVYNENGTIGHAEVRIGNSVVMLFDSGEGWPETPSFLRLFVEDADAVYQRALEAGATSVTEIRDLFFGDRVGRVRDRWGNIWWIQTHVRDVSPDEMASPSQEHIDAMRYVQESLDRELRSRSRT